MLSFVFVCLLNINNEFLLRLVLLEKVTFQIKMRQEKRFINYNILLSDIKQRLLCKKLTKLAGVLKASSWS